MEIIKKSELILELKNDKTIAKEFIQMKDYMENLTNIIFIQQKIFPKIIKMFSSSRNGKIEIKTKFFKDLEIIITLLTKTNISVQFFERELDMIFEMIDTLNNQEILFYVKIYKYLYAIKEGNYLNILKNKTKYWFISKVLSLKINIFSSYKVIKEILVDGFKTMVDLKDFLFISNFLILLTNNEQNSENLCTYYD